MHGWIISQTARVGVKSPILILNAGRGHLAPRTGPGKPAAPSRAVGPWVFSFPRGSLCFFVTGGLGIDGVCVLSQHPEVGSAGLEGGIRLPRYLQESRLCEPCFLCVDF